MAAATADNAGRHDFIQQKGKCSASSHASLYTRIDKKLLNTPFYNKYAILVIISIILWQKEEEASKIKLKNFLANSKIQKLK